ncbi:MAG TPA: UDP-N-acetylmuramoyl-L-alanyl-D-glutamate--2,6-diaminopimelate ligase [Anaerolineales bacterium]
MKHIQLLKIFAQFPFPFEAPDISAVSITGIALDSRAVKPGYLFVAEEGATFDGHDFIPNAIQSGAAAIAGERPIKGLPVPYVRLRNSREALTWLSAAFYDWPGRRLTVIGVTGTDGKTTTTNLIYQILKAAGIRAGMVSTVNAVIGSAVLDTGFHVTTPDAHDLQRYLAMMVEAGLTHAVLETTSHGWAQHRVDACEFDIGVITNITHEHLDQHGSYENYRAAKARLFTSLERTAMKAQGNARLAVLNRDDSSFDFLNELVRVNTLSYGLDPCADLRATNVAPGLKGSEFEVVHPAFRIGVSTSLVGAYNVSNCLAALGACVVGLGIAPEIAVRGVAALEGVPGRMERIDLGQPFTAIVDFAHTPNALKVTLETARALLAKAPGSQMHRVIAVFGSAGLRDREKRRMMAETSAQLADLTVLTAEDPRTESLDAILAEMAQGAAQAGGREGETFWRVPDRGEAIRFALAMARPGDIVLTCGKGHEQSMCFGTREHPWDDRVAMRAALAEMLRKEGPRMPYLPTQDKAEAEWLS